MKSVRSSTKSTRRSRAFGWRILPYERGLQEFFEKYLRTLTGVDFLASEYSTGQRHGRVSTRWASTELVGPWLSSTNGAR